MKFRLLKAAKRDIDEAVAWYKQRSATAGRNLKGEIAVAMDRIKERPHSWASFRLGTRRYLLSDFPYHIVYHVTQDEILIVALAHYRRQPTFWRDRF